MKKNILTIIIMASCLLNLILTAVIVFAVVPTMNKTSQLVDKVATAIDLETDEEASGDYSIDNLEPYSIAFENKQTINLKPDEGDNTSHFAVLEGVTISFNNFTRSSTYESYSISLCVFIILFIHTRSSHISITDNNICFRVFVFYNVCIF